MLQQGWVFWAWKNIGAMDWSYQAGLQYGWIPSDPTPSNSVWGDNVCNGL